MTLTGKPAPRLDFTTFKAPQQGLHVVATPIGNLGDITVRALVTLQAADAIYCEDTRITRRLLERYGIETPLASYHDHNAGKMRPLILERLARGETIALVSDAGTPLVSDPGYKLVAAACEAGIAVTAEPGPSALLPALVLSGLPSDRFLFLGFLPAKSAARRAGLAEVKTVRATLIVYEAPTRLLETLADLAAILGDRRAAVARELTKLHETVRRGRFSDLAKAFAEAPKGEIVILVGPPDEEAAGEAVDIDAMLAERLAAVSLKTAVAQVVAKTGASRADVYARALALTGRGPAT